MTTERPVGEALRDLTVPPGVPGSGRLRYVAAMDLWLAGEIPAETLEVYRICAALDGEDPTTLLAARGLGLGHRGALLRLLAELDRCLSVCPGPGVAEVRAGLAAARPSPAPPAPRLHPAVTTHLPAALAAMQATLPELTSAIGSASGALAWDAYDRYPPDRIGEGFRTGNAFAVLVGDDGPYSAGDFDLGLFLIAPQRVYRDHRHAAPELYLPFTGPHGWRFGPGTPLLVKPALEPVWNEPYAPHLTKVGPVPFLCLYAWTRDAQSAAEVIPADDWPELEARIL
jgi:hypothetical protein